MRAILTYHSLDASRSVISVDPAAFEVQIARLLARGIAIVPLADLLHASPEANAVALTFDDGLASVESVAAPILRRHRLPATIFVVAGHAGGTNAWGGRSQAGIPALPVMGWDQLRALAASGLDIGAHTVTHPDLTRLSNAHIEREVRGSLEWLEAQIGIRPRSFAYPYGAISPTARAVARRCFDVACTTELGLLEPTASADALPRVDMYYFSSPTALDDFGTPAFARRLKMYDYARRLRRRLPRLIPAGPSRNGMGQWMP